MPKINRIRVNNVKYNFGTQYYDDFVMRFSGKNTIYDLANGGGKSLLMLLILQNLIPNCTLDEKQPIEKLFRPNGGNTTIHSLVEWMVDPCYMKDNFKFMTTGFCARKGRSTNDEMENESVDPGTNKTASNGLGIASRDTASIEYFNYVIFYREFGDNDLRNLPLSNGNERITYNGLKNYLRDLEKKDFGVSVKIFERKGDYQNFITSYGLFESEWDIICGINKTEGHVRTYFETNYKTSRKVVEDLLIEEIIQKSFNNKFGVENDEGKMAKTLLDIKDKLVELSKKHSEINGYDSQVKAMEDFSKQIGTFEEIYSKKEQLQKQLFDMLIACKVNLGFSNDGYDELLKTLEHRKMELSNEQKLISTAQVLEEQRSLEKISVLLEETLEAKDKLVDLIQEMRIQLLNKESANDYIEFLEYTKRYDEINETINNRLRDHEDVINELKVLALVKFEKDKNELGKLEEKIEKANQELQSEENELLELGVLERNLDRQAAVLESKAEVLQKEIEKDHGSLKILMESGLVLVSENADMALEENLEQLEKLKLDVKNEEENYTQFIQKLENSRNTINKIELSNIMLNEEMKKYKQNSEKEESLKQRLETLAKIYNENDLKLLLNMITNTFKNASKEVSVLESKLKSLLDYEVNLSNGDYVFNGKQYKLVKEYLMRHYGEDAIDGQSWFRSLNAGQKRDVCKRAPFVRYGFIIKNDFERIKADTTLQNFNHSSYVIPIMSEKILVDMKLEVNSELVRFATKNLDFLSDDAKVETEILNIREEINNSEHKLNKLKDKCELIWEDYEFVLCYKNERKYDENQKISLELTQSKLEKSNEEMENLLEVRRKLEKKCLEVKESLKMNQRSIREIEGNISVLEKTIQINGQIQGKYNEFNFNKKSAKEAAVKFEVAKQKLEEMKRNLLTKNKLLEALLEEKSKYETNWKTIYLPYYSESLDPLNSNEYSSLTMDKLESKFLGLKEVVEKETIDLYDKEVLMNTYKASYEKCKNNIEYRGLDFDEIATMYRNNQVFSSSAKELLEIKKKITSYESEVATHEKEVESQRALMNRVQGGIEHGKGQIQEKYGSFEMPSIDNPQIFIEQHKLLTKKLQENIKNIESKMKATDNQLKELLLIEKDLERIVKNAGLKIPENMNVFGNNNVNLLDEVIKVEDYEEVQREYESLIKRIDKKKEEFQRQKLQLVEKLNQLNAHELADEVNKSINVPDTAAKAKELIGNILETNAFILLEKDRISKGIDAMERIKDNFENRCIQTCSSIKTELDRLPRLSTITMDEDVISIIGLQVPYVKEEFFKDRMSSYINETVTGAESFKNAEERLKYIRNRLTWKKLFSVIVTDMNAIQINLYKRERIKDQSRYLKYEEAVGSTGQSQGIYIQFLIAIINYISSINATSHENACVGKVIFIDNPFGAAKDIYIWEPIFKLLKTNHVQLIVPARGATPAITGRFDVNYILGQKLVDGKQQTVLVDYHSQVKSEEIEYRIMDYVQATLF